MQQICVEEVSQVAIYHPAWLNAYSPHVKEMILNIGLQFSDIDETDLV
jgi:peptide/nickel transport system substrate-binding protein